MVDDVVVVDKKVADLVATDLVVAVVVGVRMDGWKIVDG